VGLRSGLLRLHYEVSTPAFWNSCGTSKAFQTAGHPPRTLYSTRILKATAVLYGGYLLLDQALAAAAKLEEGAADPFYRGKIHTAQFYLRNLVPEVIATAKQVKEADISALEMPEEAF